MLLKKEASITFTTGLALFAMFFGAGNMVFPLAIGAHAGHHIFFAWLAFMVAGVGIPFMGLFALSLYKGDYWAFFSILGKYLSFLVITFIIFIIGPLFAAPRTEDITYHTLHDLLPHWLSNHYFGLLYFLVIFILSYKHSLVIDIIGRVISPMKLFAFAVLIIASIITANALIPSHQTLSHSVQHALSVGYGTMDLLGAVFFCHVAYHNIVNKCAQIGIKDEKSIMKVTFKACLIGGLLIGLVYTGFMVSAACHAEPLQHVNTPALISAISNLVLGSYGSIFVAICVTLACIATATALAVVSSNFFYHSLFQEKVPRLICQLTVLGIMYGMSILGFDIIMAIATPILNVLYPCLIVFCIFNICRKLCTCKFKKSST